MSKPALFLDRDGVINVDIKYAHKKRDFVFVEGIFDLVKVVDSEYCLIFQDDGFVVNPEINGFDAIFIITSKSAPSANILIFNNSLIESI